MTNASTGMLRPTRLPWYRKPTTWIVGFGVVLGLLSLACVAPEEDPTPVPNGATQTFAPETTAPTQEPMTISGNGNTVVEIGATLTGAYRADWQFGYWCGIVYFLKADGQDGSELMEFINGCTTDQSAYGGSKVVHLTDVAMIQSDNTQGDWTLVLTPLG